ncbi:chemotaxis-specific protein-glutamate methyltransferase CheB [Aquisalimonas asiatica]|uniref:Protein-glutamate methylesterase/protein-glutamine glutaminase n=1 Tax=Aquisalimonas asiatica TaxID=406100 RepID=A0A1H8QRM7_9GAMM|nr:chemotaxis-specific protein-glutamate methyltransferase CheB [Aquisalimonas asiatica]SEO56611.1 two-component system, chemotaxis family, response regulator CheB [Aquisalimonas asiatica]
MLTVLVVDDSALMRRALREALQAEQDIRVEIARNGEDALEQVRRLRPDVITLDIHMPTMDGLTCLSHLMVMDNPCPVIMVSSLTEKGALATFEAIELGAFDYVAKPGGTISTDLESIQRDLVAKVRAAATGRRGTGQPARHAVEPPPPRAPVKTAPAGRASERLLVIGVSTGGPRTLEQILPRLPAGLDWPVLVIQHMPASFTSVFARRLDGMCPMAVQEVGRPTALEPGVIYIARGDADITLSRRAQGLTLVPTPANPDFLWHPSVGRFLESADDLVDADALVGVMLTGMGDDGAAAMAAWHRRGARTIAESEETAVVFGMPNELIKQGGAQETLPCDRIGACLLDWLRDGEVA